MMRVEAQAPTIRLADYRPPAFLAETIELTFRLHPTATRVLSRVTFRRNPARADEGPLDLRLDGRRLHLVSAAIDGAPVPQNALALDDEGLTVAAAHVPDAFTWEAETEISPETNTALEGLYMSRGMYCTQCEAQGFRKIAYWPDRPDVMARFRVRIEGDPPVLLSNGNLVASGPGWAEWEDPWLKPSYLFALVAGDLVAVEDRFATRSGRDVLLQISVRPGDEARCAYAMDALKRAMQWDEETYGREYDLDRFMIVAVDDFNMGAMENKGLNIFNSKFVLASPETATDADYKSIEAIIAHEYFHNWTGNRITCRDWFQLCLKEGLTVFRDQQFSADMRSAGVKRIEDVIRLRAPQFREDAEPARPPGAAGGLHRDQQLLHRHRLREGCRGDRHAPPSGRSRDLRPRARPLLERHDGQACTIEDWLQVFEDASGRDLAQFKLWYPQAGTPRLTATEHWDGTDLPPRPRPGDPPDPRPVDKRPLVVPVAFGLSTPPAPPSPRESSSSTPPAPPLAGPSRPPSLAPRASPRRSSSPARPCRPSAPSSSPTTVTPSTSGKPAAATHSPSSPASPLIPPRPPTRTTSSPSLPSPTPQPRPRLQGPRSSPCPPRTRSSPTSPPPAHPRPRARRGRPPRPRDLRGHGTG